MVRTPDDAYFAEQTPEKRATLVKLRSLVHKAIPEAEVSIKWGVPMYATNGRQVCSLAAFRDFVGINFLASPDVLPDPQKKLEGSGKTMRMYKVRVGENIDERSVLRWLKATASVRGGMKAR